MKSAIFTFIVFLALHQAEAQQHFALSSLVGECEVQVNGIRYKVDSTGIQIPTNYPKLDTLSYLSESPKLRKRILVNFKPDTQYTVILACCGSRDVVPSSRLNGISDSSVSDSGFLELPLVDKPSISIKLKQSSSDSIYAWHVDLACMTEHRLLDTSAWTFIPPKCYYWNNTTSIQFFQVHAGFNDHKRSPMEEFLGLHNVRLLSHIDFRLFDDHRWVLIYDSEEGKAELRYE